MESRIPVLDALSTFASDAVELPPEVQAELSKHGQQRWYPEPGGHRVLVPYEGGPFDSSRFSIEQGKMDHDTCDSCRTHIPAMTLCWVTRSGRYVTLCGDCKMEMDAA